MSAVRFQLRCQPVLDQRTGALQILTLIKWSFVYFHPEKWYSIKRPARYSSYKDLKIRFCESRRKPVYLFDLPRPWVPGRGKKCVFSFLSDDREGAEAGFVPFLLTNTLEKRPVVYYLPLEGEGCKCLSWLTTASESLWFPQLLQLVTHLAPQCSSLFVKMVHRWHYSFSVATACDVMWLCYISETAY